MDYAKHYDLLIARAKGRTVEGYTERHHIVPRCMGGTDEKENLVDLPGEEHYVAHQLLVRMHPNVPKLANAVWFMSFLSATNKQYGWVKRRFVEAMRGNTRSLGVRRSPETRAKMSAALMGNKNGSGKKLPPFTDEHRAKLSVARRGRRLTPEHVAKIVSANTGARRGPLSAEHKAKLSAAHMGMRQSVETVQKRIAKVRETWKKKRAATTQPITQPELLGQHRSQPTA